MKGKTLWGLILFATCMVAVPAQVNEMLDKIYQQEAVETNQGLWLLLTGAEILDEDSSLEEAQQWAGSNIKDFSEEQAYLTQGLLAQALQKAYPVPKGLMTRLTGSPRYALRDLQYLNIIPSDKQQSDGVSGFELVNSLGIVLEGVAK